MKLMSCVHQAAHSTLCACFVRYWYARVRSFPACLLSLCVSLVASVRVRAVLVVYLYKIYKVGRSTVRSRSRGGGLELYYASYHPLQTSVPATARFRSPITVRRRRHPEGLQHCNCYHPTDRQPSRDPLHVNHLKPGGEDHLQPPGLQQHFSAGDRFEGNTKGAGAVFGLLFGVGIAQGPASVGLPTLMLQQKIVFRSSASSVSSGRTRPAWWKSKARGADRIRMTSDNL